MANITIVVDDDLLKRARVRAVEEGTSVNEVCRRAIEAFAGPVRRPSPDELIARFRELASHVRPSEDGEPLWPGREVLYEEAMRERGLVKDPPSTAKASRKRRR